MFNLCGVDLNLLPMFEAAYEERNLSRRDAARDGLATVLRQHGTAWASSSTCTLGAPYDSRLAWWIVS